MDSKAKVFSSVAVETEVSGYLLLNMTC